jgi:hypothetical protein
LDVEQVEVVCSVIGRGVVEDGGGAASKVVGGDVAESCDPGSGGDDPIQSALVDGVGGVPVDLGSVLVGSACLPSGEQGQQ